jgi:hypothetical protein
MVAEVNSPVPAAMPFEKGINGTDINLRLMMLASPGRIAEIQEEALLDLRATWKASSILRKGGGNAYEKALRALTLESRNWWEEHIEAGEFFANAEGLTSFIHDHLEPQCAGFQKVVLNQPAIKAQVEGESLQAQKLENLNRYETHLDRKFERTLAMLLKLKDLRGG